MSDSHRLNIDSIVAWLQNARWFAAKHHGSLMQVEIRDSLPIGRDASGFVTHWILFIAHDGQRQSAQYMVPIRCENHDGQPGRLVNAAEDPVFLRWALDLIQTEKTVQTLAGQFIGRQTNASDALADVIGPDALEIRSIGGDASNTTVLVGSALSAQASCMGNSCVIKLIRRFRPGIQPEVEVANFLAHNNWSRSPTLLGWLEYQPAAGDQTPGVAATVHHGLHGAISLWDYLISRVHDPAYALNEIDTIVARAGTLTADMHGVLTHGEGDPAFAAIRPTQTTIAAVATKMQAHARAVFTDLATAAVPKAIQLRLTELLAHRDELLRPFCELPLTDHQAAFIRIHGDYHLGQLLIQPINEALWVIDFEGEPSRSLSERREQTSIWKDLAGMCRSFDYLDRQMSAQGGSRRADGGHLANVFLSAYRRRAAAAPFWAPTAAENGNFYRAFLLDKAIYELAYEAQNRPAWIDVPLSALEQMLHAQPDTADSLPSALSE